MSKQHRRTRPHRGVKALSVAATAACALALAACGSASPQTNGATSTTASASGATSTTGSSASSTTSDLPSFKTVTPGTITVAVEPYMPYTGMVNGKLVGLDSEIFQKMAQDLHEKVKVVNTNFAGMLADVQQQRVDVSIGDIAWSKSRQQQGLFTDSPYYSPVGLVEPKSVNLTNVSQLQGKTVGTVTGYVFQPAIQHIPNVNARTYQNAPAMFQDVASGRLTVGVLDPLLVAYYVKQHPSSGLVFRYLAPPTKAQLAKHPSYSDFEPYQTGFYLPKQEAGLEKAMNALLKKYYADGFEASVVKKWGGDPSKFLTPTPGMGAARRGVDRPSSWKPLSIG